MSITSLYIDPGTGSMLFTVLLSILGAAFYSLRMLIVKIRMKTGGKNVADNYKRIPFVIFSDDKRYWSIFDPICREMDKRGKDVVYLTCSPDDPALSSPYKHLKAECLEGNKMFSRLNFLNATIVLSTTPGLDVYQWKRSKTVQYYVHIPHAASEIILYRMFGIDYYDAILLSGEYQANDIRKLEKLRELPEKELLTVGIPYMDEMAKRYEAVGPAPEHPRTVLLAPSWGKSAIFSVWGKKIIDALLKTGYHVIIRPHPQSFKSETEMIERLMSEYPNSDRLEWNRDTDNFEVLRRSDILISDFSGVIFDFTLIYDKPVIYTDPQFDTSLYDAWWLKDHQLWTTTALPRLGKQLTDESMEHMKELIDSCITDTQYAEGRRSVKAETWEHFGEGAVRVADYLEKRYEELTRKEK
ncbi:MAG: CDP-glycerol--glycerophosphate glycerophosphotransferase [Ruminococcaceae bacterium]|nr:CDP-glycerol--glycerophosphate glycerophosphotransferase [Oscillospiraceae bacterium]